MTGTAPRALRGMALIVVSLLGIPSPIWAQAPYQDRGAVAAGLLIRQLDGVKRVLVIGAHPDDEDTSLLATLSRGMGARTAYLSLTRGEGGQNLIGPELGEGLGLVRTGELVAARGLDGGEQYFTRAFDFGYSKSAEESFRFWPREAILADVVRRIRIFRPHLIVSVFSGTRRDGHGHHQVAGELANEAFDAAGDPSRFPEQLANGLEPWQPKKLFRRIRGSAEGATAFLETGAFDPLLGRSYFQLAMESRSQHRSQDMGMPQPMGPRRSALLLVYDRLQDPDRGEESLFAGIDTTLLGLADRLPAPLADETRGHLARYRDAILAAAARLEVLRPSRAAPPLATALRELQATLAVLSAADSQHRELGEELERRASLTQRALLATASIVFDVRAERDVGVPGNVVPVEGYLWNGGGFSAAEAEFRVVAPEGWEARPMPASAGTVTPEGVSALGGGEMRRWRFQVSLPDDAHLSRPYFLEETKEEGIYRWPDAPGLTGLPGNLPQLAGHLDFRLSTPVVDGFGGTVTLHLKRPAEYVGVDKALGEYRNPFLVVPALSVSVEPRSMPWPQGETAPRIVSVRVRSAGEDPANVMVELNAPPGWSVTPPTHVVEGLSRGGEEVVSFAAEPHPGLQPGQYRFQAVARIREGTGVDDPASAPDAEIGGYRESFTVIDYPHIERTLQFAPAEVTVSVFPVKVRAGLRVGYVMGSGDDGSAALRSLGAHVELLDEESVRRGDYQGYDVVVLGVRAYETRPDLVASNELLLDYTRAGGTVVVQYNKYEFPAGGFAPYPVAMRRPHD
ncbi:MAG: PIG-L family deacetylase, partial [Gemmatimonadetes bacterium]|nr:PIG-L family deacetylase [Gemmatimonadota bacterium]